MQFSLLQVSVCGADFEPTITGDIRPGSADHGHLVSGTFQEEPPAIQVLNYSTVTENFPVPNTLWMSTVDLSDNKLLSIRYQPPPARGYPGSTSSRFFLRTFPSVQIRTDFFNSLVTAPSHICFPLYLQAASEWWRQRRMRAQARSVWGAGGSILSVSSCYSSSSPTVTRPEWGKAITLYQRHILSQPYIIVNWE